MSDYVERRFGDLTVRVNRFTCIASGNCTKIAPEVFFIGEERIVTFRDDAPDIEPRAPARGLPGVPGQRARRAGRGGHAAGLGCAPRPTGSA